MQRQTLERTTVTTTTIELTVLETVITESESLLSKVIAETDAKEAEIYPVCARCGKRHMTFAQSLAKWQAEDAELAEQDSYAE